MSSRSAGDHIQARQRRRSRRFIAEIVDFYEWVPEWSEHAACIGKWEQFDEDENQDAAVTCWTECPVRKECLISTLKNERKANRIEGEMTVVGVAGGYTVSERRVLHEAIESDGIDIDSI